MLESVRSDRRFERGLSICAGVSVLSLGAIVVFLFSQALPLFQEVSLSDFLFGLDWYPTADVPALGIGALIMGTLAVTVLTTIFAVPIGVLTAAAMHCAMPALCRRLLKPVIELMAALPSVIIGFVGMVLVAPWLQSTFGIPSGLNMMNAALMLAFMCIPTICSISEDALNSVPNVLRESSLALGATRWETFVRVELRAASHGIGTAVMLGISRAIGETMVVLMVAGGAAIVPESLFDPVRPLTSSIAAEMAEAAVGTTHYHALFASGLVLFIFTFIFNVTAYRIKRSK